MLSIRLNSGHRMPALGLGTWTSDIRETQRAVETAVDCGYRSIDAASIYGNEAQVGAGIASKIQQGVVTRDELFVTSKLWNNMHHRDFVRPALVKSLNDMQLDYVDLYLVHWPVAFVAGSGEESPEGPKFSDDDYVDTWREMEKLVDSGLCRSIGLSNFNQNQIERILEMARIAPANNQIEVNPYISNTQLIEFCQEKNISVTAYSPFGSPASPMRPADSGDILGDPLLHQIAARHAKDVTQVILRWILQRNVAAIPKSVTADRIRSNGNVFDFVLTEKDMKDIMSLDRNFRTCGIERFRPSRFYPF